MTSLIQQPVLNETQERILDAAIACVKQWGLDKTSLNDIAKQAGVTRPTVYSYFGSRDQVLSAALMRSALVFAQRSVAHINRFRSVEERFIESVLFGLEQLPKEPYLALISNAKVTPFVNQDALINQGSWTLLEAIFKQIFLPAPRPEADLREIAEITVRLILSLLMTRGPQERTPAQMRAFLERRLLPMAGLEAPVRKARRRSAA